MTRPHGDLTRYTYGPDEHGNPGPCHCAECRAANADWHRNRTRLIAYGQWEPYEDPAGTRRRIGALMRNGWSMGQIAVHAGRRRGEIHRILVRSPRVTKRIGQEFRVLYDKLWDVAPPEETPHEKMAAVKARKYAREHGFAGAWAWDDDPGPHWIDDPAATPAAGWEPSPLGAAILAARKRAGLTQAQVAAAVGVSRPFYQNWESGYRTPSDEHWEQMELTLGPLGVVRDRDAGDGDEGQQGEESDAAA